jgi:histidine triad (HIT) family protein
MSTPFPPTLFTRIINGEIPCHKVYEDDKVFAFLDIGPLSPGHTLVIPKEPALTVDKLSDDSAAAIGRVLPRICRAVINATGTSDLNILQNNGKAAHQEVPHVHFHIIPKPSGSEGLGIDWPSQKIDHIKGAELAKAIAAAI